MTDTYELPPDDEDAGRYAPPGKVWKCLQCGNLSRDQYGAGVAGWDDRCMLNCYLVSESDPKITREQFENWHERYMERVAYAECIERAGGDPVLLELARRVTAKLARSPRWCAG